MKLLIDAGNTRVKWRAGLGKGSMSGAAAWDSVELAGLFVDAPLEEVVEVLVSCVASREKKERLAALVASRFSGVTVSWIEGSQGLGGITYAYDNIAKLGVDRILVMIAARALVHGSFMVIDCGSAITADLVDGNAQHLGGYIFPGIGLLKGALTQGTGNVAVSSEGFGDSSPGSDTEECVEHAINLMLISTIRGLLAKAGDLEVGAVFITGGDAQRVISLVGFQFDCRPDMVLDGLLHVYKKG